MKRYFMSLPVVYWDVKNAMQKKIDQDVEISGAISIFTTMEKQCAKIHIVEEFGSWTQ